MAVATERMAQEAYWKEHTSNLSVEAMMLDSQASTLDLEERPEILNMLPSYKGLKVLELGAGIGRFTAPLAEQAAHVVAVDFMANAIAENKEQNGHHKNVDFRCADVTGPELKFEASTMDLVFSNWLLMYLSDAEVEDLAQRCMKWLKPGGFLFFRESCFHQSGDHKRKSNPTHYREPLFYTKVFEKLRSVDGKQEWGLQLLACKNVRAYVRNKRSQNQLCWLWQKVKMGSSAEDGGVSQQGFLDAGQYSTHGIRRYERVFGDGFVSSGGLDTTKELAAKLELQAGERVLDVGCGLGGSALYMAQHLDAHVTGIDLSINMISLALERAIGCKCAIEFELADCTLTNYPEASFDVIWSRDTILHIKDKGALFAAFFRWLKPGGRLLITDYCCGSGHHSPDFRSYVTSRGYHLLSVEEYGRVISRAGFIEVVATDCTHQFVNLLKKELRHTEEAKDSFVTEFSEEDYTEVVGGWTAKLERCAKGDQKWGLFTARKARQNATP
eukprot:jgi/Mesen1/7001/ME000365S06140